MRIGRGFTVRKHSGERGEAVHPPDCGLRGGITTLSRVRHRDPVSAHDTTFRGGSAAKRREVGVIQRERFFSDTQATGGLSTNTFQPETLRQGRGMFHPPPRQPHPQGGDFPSTHCHGEDEQIRGLDVNTLPKIRFMLPVHCIRDNRQTLPAPSQGAGGGRASGRAGGGGST